MKDDVSPKARATPTPTYRVFVPPTGTDYLQEITTGELVKRWTLLPTDTVLEVEPNPSAPPPEPGQP